MTLIHLNLSTFTHSTVKDCPFEVIFIINI